MQTTPPKKLQRRDFLKTALTLGGALAALEVGGVALAYLQPHPSEGEFGGSITVGPVDDFPPGSVTHIPSGRFYLTRLPDGGFLAVFQRCTHLGCTVPWDPTAGMFICPCHSSQFTPDGAVLNPPAPRPLDLFPLRIEAGQIIIETASPIQRAAFETTQVVYP